MASTAACSLVVSPPRERPTFVCSKLAPSPALNQNFTSNGIPECRHGLEQWSGRSGSSKPLCVDDPSKRERSRDTPVSCLRGDRLCFLRQYQLGQVQRVASPQGFPCHQPLSPFGGTPLTVRKCVDARRAASTAPIRQMLPIKRLSLRYVRHDRLTLICLREGSTSPPPMRGSPRCSQ